MASQGLNGQDNNSDENLPEPQAEGAVVLNCVDKEESARLAQAPPRKPSFSLEDRSVPLEIKQTRIQQFLRSDISVFLVYSTVYLIPHLASIRYPRDDILVCFFICWHFGVTCSKSVFDYASTIEELNMRTNASTFVAMVLYPALGIWTCQEFSNADSFFIVTQGEQFQWGTIFPVLMWGLSSVILVRESYHAIRVDSAAVVSKKGRAAHGLFYRNPGTLELFANMVGYTITLSIWHVLPTNLRPAGGVGRFCFQLIAPVVLLFLYIGLRFILFSAQTLERQWGCYPSVCLNDFQKSNKELTAAIFYIWVAFTCYCCMIRGFVTSPLFLKLTVADKQTRKWLSPRWPLATVESKRQRVLWAFRGLAGAIVPYYYTVAQNVPDKAESFGDQLLWYMYVSVYVSFLMEGVGALFFALLEAERGCHLRTPFGYFMKESFWFAYNSYLQPMGTLVNLVFALLNGELRTKLKLRELFGPLLNDRGEFRAWLWKKRVIAAAVTEKELEDWVATWKRKRESVGKAIDTLDIVEAKPTPSSPPLVFEGSVFPTWHERIDMIKHNRQHISLKPWEQHDSEEKFERWHPTYREEVLSLLAEPYNFQKSREVWVFGYGSLMSPDSPPAGLNDRQRKLFLPYWIRKEAGFQRVWNYRHGSVGINAVGLCKVSEDQADHICGIAYPMDHEFASDLLSKREDGYRLLLLHEDLMAPMHEDYRIPDGCGYIWIVGEPISQCLGPENESCDNYKCKRHWPTDDSPILQSYVDEIIAGCLKYRTTSGKTDGMKFAAAVIQSIRGWMWPWFNDRILSGRPWKFAADYELTDGLLNTCPTSHFGFLRRKRPILCTSPILSRLYESAHSSSARWCREFYKEQEAQRESLFNDDQVEVARNSVMQAFGAPYSSLWSPSRILPPPALDCE